MKKSVYFDNYPYKVNKKAYIDPYTTIIFATKDDVIHTGKAPVKIWVETVSKRKCVMKVKPLEDNALTFIL